jgi:hypothetical protein
MKFLALKENEIKLPATYFETAQLRTTFRGTF